MDSHLDFASIQAGIQQLYALILTYSLSAAGAVLLLIAGYLISRFAERGVVAGLAHIHGFDLTLRRFFAKVVRYAILLLTLVVVLGQFGVQTASIIAALGAVGLAIGLALQGTLQNIAAGIMLLALRPFRIGEDVEIGQIAGTIEEIGLFATRLRTADGIYVLAPNSTLWNQPVRNMSRNGMRRNDITLAIGHVADIDQAQDILLELARTDKRVKDAPASAVFVTTPDDSTLVITLRYWTAPEDHARTKADLTARAKKAFDAQGITTPVPQQEIIYRDARQ